MQPRTNASLGTALAGALGAINATKASVKQAAAQVYTAPGDTPPSPAPGPGTTPGH
jgi:hypothetical protein